MSLNRWERDTNFILLGQLDVCFYGLALSVNLSKVVLQVLIMLYVVYPSKVWDCLSTSPQYPGYGKVPEHASIARRKQGIFVGRKKKYMKNFLWKYEKEKIF